MSGPVVARRARLHFDDTSLAPLDRVRLVITGGLDPLADPPEAPTPMAPVSIEFSLEQKYVREANAALTEYERTLEAATARRNRPPPPPQQPPPQTIVPDVDMTQHPPPPTNNGRPGRVVPKDVWVCPVCTFHNRNFGATACEVCNNAHTPEWICSACTLKNSMDATVCAVCSTART